MARRSDTDKTLEAVLSIIIFVPICLFWVAEFLLTGVVKMFQSMFDSILPKGVATARIVERIQRTKDKYQHSGMSFGINGNPRLYYRVKNVPTYVEVKFLVTFENGKAKTISTIEGSKKYYYLLEYSKIPGQAEQTRQTRPEPEPQRPAAEKASEPEKPKAKKYYLDIPFEIAPNEYSLSILYPSCQMERRPDGESRINVRFEARYDVSAKGLRNRVVKCSTIDAQGRMTDTMRETRTLDASGSQMIDITFWRNVDDEPAKVIVGLDRYN